MVAESATSLRRGLAILFALEAEESATGRGLGVTQLAALIGRDKSQVSRTLSVLAEFGIVERDAETREFRLGQKLALLAARSSHARLLASAPPLLHELVAELKETAYLSVLEGPGVATVYAEAPNRAVVASGSVRGIVPAFCTSAGRALLLDHDLPQLQALLSGETLAGGPRAPTSVEDVHRRIVAARRKGYAVVDEEFEPGLVAVGAPVRDFRGRIVAAVNVSAPKFRFSDRLDAAGPAVLDVADRLSIELGWQPGEVIAQ